MSIELIGLFAQTPEGGSALGEKALFDRPFMERLVKDYEEAGYDRMLIANSASWADSIPVAAYVAAISSTLKFMIAHRPGFVQPTMAARMMATIDQLSNGRAGVHIITGASDVEMQSDGDFLPKADRYYRSAEYAEVLRQVWESPTPVDHDGEYFRFFGQDSKVKPFGRTIPIYWGGASGAALEMAAKAADVYAFGVEPLARAKSLIEEVKGYADGYGRQIGFCMSSKIIIGDTEEQAWDYAREIAAKMAEKLGKAPTPSKLELGPNARRLEMAELPDIQDERLWMGLNKLVGGKGHTVSFVGTGEQIAESLLKYYDLGVRSFLFHGYDAANDPKRYGQSLIPALRAGAAAKEKAGEAAFA